MKRTTSNAVLFADGEIGKDIIMMIMEHQLYSNYILGKNF